MGERPNEVHRTSSSLSLSAMTLRCYSRKASNKIHHNLTSTHSNRITNIGTRLANYPKTFRRFYSFGFFQSLLKLCAPPPAVVVIVLAFPPRQESAFGRIKKPSQVSTCQRLGDHVAVEQEEKKSHDNTPTKLVLLRWILLSRNISCLLSIQTSCWALKRRRRST